MDDLDYTREPPGYMVGAAGDFQMEGYCWWTGERSAVGFTSPEAALVGAWADYKAQRDPPGGAGEGARYLAWLAYDGGAALGPALTTADRSISHEEQEAERRGAWAERDRAAQYLRECSLSHRPHKPDLAQGLADAAREIEDGEHLGIQVKAREDLSRQSIVAFIEAEATRFADEVRYSLMHDERRARLEAKASELRTLAAYIARGDDRRGA